VVTRPFFFFAIRAAQGAQDCLALVIRATGFRERVVVGRDLPVAAGRFLTDGLGEVVAALECTNESSKRTTAVKAGTLRLSMTSTCARLICPAGFLFSAGAG
jgi:hypothetical protein